MYALSSYLTVFITKDRSNYRLSLLVLFFLPPKGNELELNRITSTFRKDLPQGRTGLQDRTTEFMIIWHDSLIISYGRIFISPKVSIFNFPGILHDCLNFPSLHSLSRSVNDLYPYYL